MKCMLSLLALTFLVSCGPMVRVDFDESQDFSEFTTYKFYPDIDSGLNQLDDKRVMHAIDSVLQQKGFKKDNFNRFYVNFYASERISDSRSSIGIGVGSGGRNGGVGVSGGIPIGGPRVSQVLTIDIVDAYKDQELVWQAVVEGQLNERASPAKKEAYYYSVISKALKKFPPENK